ncbi:MAG: hypothetical protein ACI8VC_000465 [Candidatus Endobugula sp.]|jgi:hypothetical protein
MTIRNAGFDFTQLVAALLFLLTSIPMLTWADRDYMYDDQPIPDFILNQFPAGSPYRNLSSIGQLRARQANDFLSFLDINTPRPNLNSANPGTYAAFEQANNEYIAAEQLAQNQMNAIFQGFQTEFAIMRAQEGFDFADIRNNLASVNALRRLVNSLGGYAFYPAIDQAIEFVINTGRFIENRVSGDPLASWASNPSYAGKSGPNCYGHATGPACRGRAQSTPGDYSGVGDATFNNDGTFELNNVLSGLVSDGLSLMPIEGGYPIFFVLNRHDYHFYRQDNDGTWSHKPGDMRVKRSNMYGGLITNPMSLSVNEHGGYCPVCFFWAPPGFNVDNINLGFDPDNPGKPPARK